MQTIIRMTLRQAAFFEALLCIDALNGFVREKFLHATVTGYAFSRAQVPLLPAVYQLRLLDERPAHSDQIRLGPLDDLFYHVN